MISSWEKQRFLNSGTWGPSLQTPPLLVWCSVHVTGRDLQSMASHGIMVAWPKEGRFRVMV